MLNTSWGNDRILRHRRVNVGIATDAERGLVVPVVVDADALGRLRRSPPRSTGSRAPRAPARSARPIFAGATIAVTNAGSYGSEYGTPC